MQHTINSIYCVIHFLTDGQTTINPVYRTPMNSMCHSAKESERVMKQMHISRIGLKEVEILGTCSGTSGVKVSIASENWDRLAMLLTKSCTVQQHL